MAKMKWYHWVVIFFITFGAINIGINAWFDFNLISKIPFSKYFFNSIGLSGLYSAFFS